MGNWYREIMDPARAGAACGSDSAALLVCSLHIPICRGNAVYTVRSQSKCFCVFSRATTHRTYKIWKQINADAHNLNKLKNMFLVSA